MRHRGAGGVSLKSLFPDLNEDELKALNYFITNISVGEIVAVRELEALEGIRDARRVIETLVEKGLLERGEGCFNLPRSLREKLKELGFIRKSFSPIGF